MRKAFQSTLNAVLLEHNQQYLWYTNWNIIHKEDYEIIGE